MSATIAISGTAGEQIRQLDTPEKCATYFVEHVEAYDAVNHVWRHVRELLMLEGRAGKPIDAPKPIRAQGALVTMAEIERLVEFWKRQAKPDATKAMEITPIREDDEKMSLCAGLPSAIGRARRLDRYAGGVGGEAESRLHRLFCARVDDTAQGGADVLVCSDHPEATRSAMALVASIEGLRPLDAQLHP